MVTPLGAKAPSPRSGLPVTGGILRNIDPRYLVAFLVTLVLVVGEYKYAILGGYPRLALALGTCVGAEAALSWFMRGRVVNLQSAYISGISLSLLTKPQGGLLWPFVLGGILAISSKYALQYRSNHLWNPTNLAISLLLLAAPDRVSVLSHQWGNDVATNLVIWGFGLLIVARVRVLHVTLTYVASFLLLAGLRSVILSQPLLPEIAPLTGPMYQLFIFFMVTDPRTTVSTRRGRIVVVMLVALMEAMLRLASDLHVPMPLALSAAPAILALAIIGPMAKFIDLGRAARPMPVLSSG